MKASLRSRPQRILILRGIVCLNGSPIHGDDREHIIREAEAKIISAWGKMPNELTFQGGTPLVIISHGQKKG